MKKILIGLASAGAVAALTFAATGAFFSDEEKSTGNTFQAGAIDLKIDSTCHYYQNGIDVGCRLPNGDTFGTWTSKDLTNEKFFNFGDVKPGDRGEDTISLTGSSNPYWACVNITPTHNDDVSLTEPEKEAGDVDNTDSLFDGELAQNMHFKIWADDGDNTWEAGETILTEGDGPITPRAWAIADASTGTPLAPDVTKYLGVEWSVPASVGNIIQTDKYLADISFNVVQARNNMEFRCPVTEGFPTNTLRLENENIVEGGPWTIIADGIHADLTWTDGPTFNYTLNAEGLPANAPYDLIYYADGWPGNHPGALIGKHTTDGSGKIVAGVGSPELNMDLPNPLDGNYAIGAKIWLIPDAAYDDATKSVIVWPPDFNTWLFEGNVYIHYNDTNN